MLTLPISLTPMYHLPSVEHIGTEYPKQTHHWAPLLDLTQGKFRNRPHFGTSTCPLIIVQQQL
jgi:hypothetical protein